ncbi:MAG: hypothetical protein GX640_13150 [Fibrobacter sp.]|nr:hypothetical protein [Fibrobacter sp.]
MNSREVVRRTFEFSYPERVAHSFHPTDFTWCGVHIPGTQYQWKRVGERQWTRVDEWGNIWQRSDCESRGKKIKGGLHEITESANFTFPDFSNQAYYLTTKTAFEEFPDKWHIALLSGSTFEIANALLDNYTNAVYTDRKDIQILHDRIDSVLKIQILKFKECGADSVMIVEDLAGTFQLPPGPELWREEFKPRLSAICDYAHSLGLSVIIHCLEETSFVKDHIEAGADCIEIDTPQTVGIDALKVLQESYPVTFWCPVDINTTLQTKNEEIIRKSAHEMLDKLWRGRGGFIAGYYWDNVSLGLSPEWQFYATDEFIRYGKAAYYR